MPRKKKDILGRQKRDAELSMKDWQHRAHYHSPREAESWDAPQKQQMRFEDNPAIAAQQVMADYGAEVLKDASHKPANRVFQDRRADVLRQVAASQEERAAMQPKPKKPYIDLDEEAKKRRMPWWKRMFRR